MRATVCFVERQVGRRRSERPTPARTARPGSLFMLLETSWMFLRRGAVTRETGGNHILTKRGAPSFKVAREDLAGQ
jgi:hypothetical protein